MMYLTLHADTAGGIVDRTDTFAMIAAARHRPRWRSIVTTLSTAGVDLWRDEFLEFWLFQASRRNRPTGPEFGWCWTWALLSEDALASRRRADRHVAPTRYLTAGSSRPGAARYEQQRTSGIFNAARR